MTVMTQRSSSFFWAAPRGTLLWRLGTWLLLSSPTTQGSLAGRGERRWGAHVPTTMSRRTHAASS